MTGLQTDVVTWDREDLGDHRDDVLAVYAEAMQVPRAVARSRRPIITSHLERRGLRAVAGLDGERIVGVAYGYLGAPGQWWHDQVRAALSADQAERWLTGAFEVCELHVRPGAQGRGLGRRLLDALLSDTSAKTAVLTTPDAETRARGFYRAGGWVDLAGQVAFPGDARAFAVLAKDVHA